jgi:hypothetical protein
MQEWGKIIMLIGALVVVYGLFLWRGINPLAWVGNLPGDIHIKNKNVSIYIPITTMIIFSILLSLIIYIFRK